MPDRRHPIAAIVRRLALVGPARGRRVLGEGAALVVLVGAIAVVDRLTGAVVSFALFYLFPVSLATVRCGNRWGLAMSGLAALAWGVASRPEGSTLATDTGNALLRFTLFAFVVLLHSVVASALRDARASDRRSREFLGFAAHQLRTPTASVRATAQSLLAQGSTAADEEALLRLMSESNRMGRLVSAMLRYLRLERGDALDPERGDAAAICRAEVERHADLLTPLRVRLVLPAEPSGVHVPVDAAREVLDILLDNAGRHAREEITVTVDVGADFARLRVHDDGPGLPAGAEEQAFEPFVSLDGHGGSGLGLAIGRRLLEARHGSLEYDGEAFVAVIPAAPAVTAARAQPVARAG